MAIVREDIHMGVMVRGILYVLSNCTVCVCSIQHKTVCLLLLQYYMLAFVSLMYENIITNSDSSAPVNDNSFPLTPNLKMINIVVWRGDRGVDMWDLPSVMSTIFSTFCLIQEKMNNNTDIYFTLDHYHLCPRETLVTIYCVSTEGILCESFLKNNTSS